MPPQPNRPPRDGTCRCGPHSTVAEHDSLGLSERDRLVFFDALIDPPEPGERLVRALAEHRRRIAR